MPDNPNIDYQHPNDIYVTEVQDENEDDLGHVKVVPPGPWQQPHALLHRAVYKEAGHTFTGIDITEKAALNMLAWNVCKWKGLVWGEAGWQATYGDVTMAAEMDTLSPGFSRT